MEFINSLKFNLLERHPIPVEIITQPGTRNKWNLKAWKEHICYQRSYNLGFKWFHIKIGLTLAIEIKHQHMMNNLSVLK